ncbi:MAG: helix-turn-helix transcriptional regulator [Pseudomonadota bacterium]
MSDMSDKLRSSTELGNAIRDLRMQQKISATELAQRSGRSRDLIWRLESGRDVSSSALFDVLRVLGSALQVTAPGLPTLEEMRERFKEDD